VPIELFDRHLYEKGSLVLHMIRRTVGDELFFQITQAFTASAIVAATSSLRICSALFEDANRPQSRLLFSINWVYKRRAIRRSRFSSGYDDKQKIASVTVKADSQELLTRRRCFPLNGDDSR